LAGNISVLFVSLDKLNHKFVLCCSFLQNVCWDSEYCMLVFCSILKISQYEVYCG